MAITPDDVRTVVFKSSSLLRHGYDMGEVDDFLDEVALAMDDLIRAQQHQSPQPPAPRPGPARSESVPPQEAPPTPDQHQVVGELRARVRDLESELAARKAAPAPAPPPAPQPRPAPGNDLLQRLDELERENERLRKESEKDLMGISSRAVNLLSQAQRTADQTIADADKYARDLVMNARAQFQEILQRAQALSRVSGNGLASGASGPTTTELEYVRSCAQLAQAQLHALLATLPPEVSTQSRHPSAEM
ncbi:DivIVA domain-containing protein [Rhodococcus triatomae]|uniref:Cell wall synthesis protein Wag31 n=1 Tax=Rhodococcus triatomae TaxID=300028 RepID=A0A1G8PL72_9NOCA|nr:DivIVA domain-containing protein [Rhodococcus triatomae]QNG20132.1 DivIVA domain-containing protein [Rhodococcus triatomae]QNG23952.1 DivIVA domain-containing protein [Rhodococcus triatomae]SDI93038.1 DivIVA domain-containing protein [Rhodococcus triatomae]